jgi:NADPH-dependent curcumin reductase CurA
MPLLNARARVPVCGLIATYNDSASAREPDRLGLLVATRLRKRIRMQEFIIFDDYGPRFGEFSSAMRQWVADGKIKVREHCVEGLEKAPEAFIGLLQGENFGKLVIRVAP